MERHYCRSLHVLLFSSVMALCSEATIGGARGRRVRRKEREWIWEGWWDVGVAVFVLVLVSAEDSRMVCGMDDNVKQETTNTGLGAESMEMYLQNHSRDRTVVFCIKKGITDLMYVELLPKGTGMLTLSNCYNKYFDSEKRIRVEAEINGDNERFDASSDILLGFTQAILANTGLKEKYSTFVWRSDNAGLWWDGAPTEPRSFPEAQPMIPWTPQKSCEGGNWIPASTKGSKKGKTTAVQSSSKVQAEAHFFHIYLHNDISEKKVTMTVKDKLQTTFMTIKLPPHTTGMLTLSQDHTKHYTPPFKVVSSYRIDSLTIKQASYNDALLGYTPNELMMEKYHSLKWIARGDGLWCQSTGESGKSNKLEKKAEWRK